MNIVLALRGVAAVLVLTTLVGGMPRIVQAGLAAAFGLWAALVVGDIGASAGGASGIATNAELTLIAARELVIGATIGIGAAVPLLAATMAGRVVDVGGATKGPYASLFGVLAAAVFVGIDGHVAVVRAVVESYARVPAITEVQPRVIDALAGLVPSAVTLAIPWLVTAAVVELAVGAGVRLAGRAGVHAPTAAAVPAALVMITATLVSTLAVGVAALVRASL